MLEFNMMDEGEKFVLLKQIIEKAETLERLEYTKMTGDKPSFSWYLS